VSETIDMKSLAESYNAVRKQVASGEGYLPKLELLPELKPCRLFMDPKARDRAQIESIAKERAHDCIGGWLRRQSAIEIWPLTEDASVADRERAAAGLALAGEWAIDKNRGGRLQYLGGETWREWTYEELPDEAQKGIAVLREDAQLLAHSGVVKAIADEAGLANGRSTPRYIAAPNVAEGIISLNYVVYWGLRDDANAGKEPSSRQMQRLAARFIGFGFQDKETQQ
jgi:hypothetical protein